MLISIQIRDIGSGNFGVAKLMRDKVTGELVAVKFIERGEKVSLGGSSSASHVSVRHIPRQLPVNTCSRVCVSVQGKCMWTGALLCLTLQTFWVYNLIAPVVPLHLFVLSRDPIVGLA